MGAIELAKADPVFIVKECHNAEEAQTALNEFVIEKGYQIATQVYQTINDALWYIFVFIKPQTSGRIAVPEVVMRKPN